MLGLLLTFARGDIGMLLAEQSIKKVTKVTILLSTAPFAAKDTEGHSQKLSDLAKGSGEWQRQQNSPSAPHKLAPSHQVAPVTGWTVSVLSVALCCSREF